MRAKSFDLLTNVVSSYDQTKTTTQGRVASKTVNSKTVLGPPLNKFIDVFTDTALAPLATHVTSNNRVFIIGTITAGVMPILLYSFNTTTGAYAYVGRVNAVVPNAATTTHTIRALKVQDSGTTGWSVFVVTTASVLINGGTFQINNLALADFVPVGPATIPFATGNGQKAVYLHQDPANIGVGQLQTAAAGAVYHRTSNLLYVHNGISATHQFYIYNTATSPTYSTDAITGTAATDLINHAGHSYADNTPIVFTALTGGAGLTAGTVYFVRSAVPGVSYQVSATTGGAAINFTTDISAGSVGRAFGTTGSNFVHKTGNLPALTGTLLLTDSEDYAEPAGVNVSVDGLPCAFFGTSSAMYLGVLSELTAGATSWPSLQTCNLLGTANQIAAPTATYMAWSNVLNRAVYVANSTVFVMKPFINNVISKIFGGTNNKYFEGIVGSEVVELGLVAMTSMDLEQGWLAVGSSVTVGQRGIFLADLYSDEVFDYSYLVSKVLDTPQSVYKFITVIAENVGTSGSLKVYYRTSGFGSISGGWLLAPALSDLVGVVTPGAQVQLKVAFATLSLDTSIPLQLSGLFLGLESDLENSVHWAGDHENSTRSAESPAKSVAILEKAYASAVPAMSFRAYARSSGSLVIEKFTDTDAAEFEYSANSGTSWNALGVVPNVINTTRLRYNWSTPIPVDVDVVWQEK